jgi:Holliday junction resolvase RusA-like endonuclease
MQWQNWTYAAWLEAGRPTFHRPEVSIRCYFATQRKRDAENYGMKSLIDSLTRAGAWEDDNADVYLQHRAELLIDKHNPRVEITITERGAA